MSDFDDMLARGNVTPVYVLEWGSRSHALGASLPPGASELTEPAGTFTGWPSFGYAQIDEEILAWSGVSEDGGALLNLRRGLHRSGAAGHDAGAVLREYGLWRPLLSRAHGAWPDGVEVLRPPRIGALGIDPQKRAASLSDVTLSLVEAPHPDDPRAAFLADLIAHANGPHGNGLRERRATLWLGFEELGAAGEFRPIARGIVAGLHSRRQGTAYSLRLRALHGELKDRRLFAVRETRLAEAIDESATGFSLADAGALIDPGGALAHARMDDEFISYTGVSGNDLTGVTRGVFGSVARAHETGDGIRQVRHFEAAHPLTRFLQILTSTGGGSNGAYDVLGEDEGLGIDAALINIAAIEAIRDDLATQARVAFVISEEVEDAKAWLEEQLLVPAGCALSLDDQQRIAPAFYGPPLPAQAPPLLDAADHLHGGSLDADLGLAGVINVVEVRYSRDPVSEKFRGRVLALDNDSIAAHGSARKLVLELEGVHGVDSPVDASPAGDSAAALAASRLLGRYASPRRTLAWSAPLTRSDVPVGTLIEVSEERLPAVVLDEGARLHASRGNERALYEVVSRSADYARGVVGLRLLESEFTGKRYLFIHDDAAPDYDAADHGERRYGYLAADTDTAATLNETPLPFADGGEAYRMYPA